MGRDKISDVCKLGTYRYLTSISLTFSWLTIAQGHWCIRIVSYTGLIQCSEEQELVRLGGELCSHSAV